MTAKVLVGDCREVLQTLEANSIDACCTDPPYGLEFMGKEWDAPWQNKGAVISDPAKERGGFQDGNGGNPYSRSRIEYGRGNRGESKALQSWHETWAREVYRVLKPGAHLLAFSGTRTSHRMVCAIEDAGFEIRDCLMWLYGSGFPKSLDVSKAMDKAAGMEREVVGQGRSGSGRESYNGQNAGRLKDFLEGEYNITAPATDLARHWDGWGTALKPAYEPIILARKPLTGSVAANVTQYGTGALNIDATRIGTDGRPAVVGHNGKEVGTLYEGGFGGSHAEGTTTLGRWPANLLLDEDAARLLDEMSGERPSGGSEGGRNLEPSNAEGAVNFLGKNGWKSGAHFGDRGGASRFFYTSKSSRAERNKGLEGMPEQMTSLDLPQGGIQAGNRRGNMTQNHHPTVKPVDLMQWLVRLITPKGGTVLDPFTGSGSTGIAADREGFDFIGIEQDPEYAAIARKRIVGDCPLFTTLAAD